MSNTIPTTKAEEKPSNFEWWIIQDSAGYHYCGIVVNEYVHFVVDTLNGVYMRSLPKSEVEFRERVKYPSTPSPSEQAARDAAVLSLEMNLTGSVNLLARAREYVQRAQESEFSGGEAENLLVEIDSFTSSLSSGVTAQAQADKRDEIESLKSIIFETAKSAGSIEVGNGISISANRSKWFVYLNGCEINFLRDSSAEPIGYDSPLDALPVALASMPAAAKEETC